MDAKSKLQQKVLALKRGYTASDIKYACTRTKRDKWRATVCISYLEFPTTNLFYNKRQAETAAAKNVLDCWTEVSKRLKRNRKNTTTTTSGSRRRRGRIKETPWEVNYDTGSSGEEKDEKRWSSGEDDDDDNYGDYDNNKGPSQEDYIRVGKLMYEVYRIFQRDA